MSSATWAPIAVLAAGFDGELPVLFLEQHQGVADAVVDLVAEGELEVGVGALFGEPTAGGRGVTSDQQLVLYPV